jgi:hypothetical protein
VRLSSPPPLKDVLTDANGLVSNAWAMFFRRSAPKTSSGSITDLPSRLTNADDGYVFTALEYARSFVWFARGGSVNTSGTAVTWVSGDKFTPSMIGRSINVNGVAYTVSAFTSPTALTLGSSAGTLTAVRYTSMFWERLEGNADPHRYIWADESPGAGWAVADGTSVTRTKADGTTESFTPKNLIGQYVKGAVAAAAPAAQTLPTITGVTGDESAHTHSIAHNHGTITSGGPGTGLASVSPGSPYSVAHSLHSHDVTIPALTANSGAGAAHHHDQGTLALSGTVEPAHVSLIPYYRL